MICKITGQLRAATGQLAVIISELKTCRMEASTGVRGA